MITLNYIIMWYLSDKIYLCIVHLKSIYFIEIVFSEIISFQIFECNLTD